MLGSDDADLFDVVATPVGPTAFLTDLTDGIQATVMPDHIDGVVVVKVHRHETGEDARTCHARMVTGITETVAAFEALQAEVTAARSQVIGDGFGMYV